MLDHYDENVREIGCSVLRSKQPRAGPTKPPPAMLSKKRSTVQLPLLMISEMR